MSDGLPPHRRSRALTGIGGVILLCGGILVGLQETLESVVVRSVQFGFGVAGLLLVAAAAVQTHSTAIETPEGGFVRLSHRLFPVWAGMILVCVLVTQVFWFGLAVTSGGASLARAVILSVVVASCATVLSTVVLLRQIEIEDSVFAASILVVPFVWVTLLSVWLFGVAGLDGSDLFFLFYLIGFTLFITIPGFLAGRWTNERLSKYHRN